MILAPHPDDEIFGCAPLLLEAIRSGAEIHTIILTSGRVQGDPDSRAEESREAARRLGAPEPVFWDFEDRSLETADTRLAERISSALHSIRPTLLALPSPAEIHPDHRAVALCAWKVIRRLLRTDPEILPSDFRIAACEISAPLRPNTLVDLTDSWKTILHAARAFSSQNQLRPYLEVLEAMAVLRCLTLPAGVTRAAGYFVTDLEFILNHNTKEWASMLGPSAGLEHDDPEPESDHRTTSKSLWKTLLLRRRRP